YGFLAGTWPFGIVEAIWAAIAVARYRKLRPGRYPTRHCRVEPLRASAELRMRRPVRTRRKRRAGSAARDRLAVAAGVRRIIPPFPWSPQGRRLGRAQSPFEPATARPTARRITRRSAAEARSYPPPLSVGQLLSTG